MVVKVYISGISGNKEVKKRQQRVQLILDSKNIPYEIIDIAEPGADDAKEFMQNNSTMLGGTIGDPNPRHPLPPQIFNDDEYCGDYDAFDMANEIDEMEKFLKVESTETPVTIPEPKITNGDVAPEEKHDEEPTVTNGEVGEPQKAEEVKEDVEKKEETQENVEDSKEEEGSGDKKDEESEETKEENEENKEESAEKAENKVENEEEDAGDFWGGNDD